MIRPLIGTNGDLRVDAEDYAVIMVPHPPKEAP